MTTYTIAYELTLTDGYKGFYEHLESYPHCRMMSSCWLIQSDSDAGEIRDKLVPFMNHGDSLFVAELSYEWAGAGTHCGNWLSAPEREA
ncbi:hypothetical protein [Modicisalibacter xianhensis]|uniref:NIPSNAP protein n=1 Tax=Modicisalibacter xianhensis TaxID=442341 RepID=A0A1I2ZXN2_9GAMM|nr:hypothetical protein [Halomonas xianhensis]SFH42597.1 hypothetical protein SAMN04487959_1043 [Halomonas xianhensis]